MPAIIASQTPPDALGVATNVDVISTSEARTLDELFRERVRRCPEQTAYSQYDSQAESWRSFTWADVALQVERWQVAFRNQGLVKGERVAICFRNSVEWVVFDQAAMRLGLVVVPLNPADRAESMAYAIADSRAKLVFLEDPALWLELERSNEDLGCIDIALAFSDIGIENRSKKLTAVSSWLPEHGQHLERGCTEADDLASIVYTSGATDRPKGVMLSHKNILSNAYATLRSLPVKSDARILSFLPLSHTLQRTISYYASVMAGAFVSFSRSSVDLVDDLSIVRPTVLVSAPRVFERLHGQLFEELGNASKIGQSLFRLAVRVGWRKFQYRQGRGSWHMSLLLAPALDRLVCQKVRDKLGGELEMVIVAGAPLPRRVAKTFIALGIPLLQGYGLTESSSLIAVNTLNKNKLGSIGLPLRGVVVKIMDNDELWARGENIMLGYWGMPEASAKAVDDGWLKTGDRAALDKEGFLTIIGRVEETLMLTSGDKVSPPDIEEAILRDSIFAQVMIIGEASPFLGALVVLNSESWSTFACAQGLTVFELNSKEVRNELLARISIQIDDFPSYSQIRKVFVCSDPWSIENGLLTPTLKMKRAKIMQRHADDIKRMNLIDGVSR